LSLLSIISIILFIYSGILTLIIGCRFIFAKKYFIYHREIIKKDWDDIEKPIQLVLLAVYKMAGLGIILLGLILIFNTGISIINPVYDLNTIAIQIAVLLFWIGTFLVTHKVFIKTKANTPWKPSMLSVIVIMIAIICKILSL
jgi:hypothetical protein